MRRLNYTDRQHHRKHNYTFLSHIELLREGNHQVVVAIERHRTHHNTLQAWNSLYIPNGDI